MSKHTPAPWVIDSAGKIVSEDHVICDLRYPIYPVSSPDELSANARLIAAAPELLAIARAYRNLLKAMASTDGEIATFEHIERVIAKAEGGAE